MPEQPHPYDGLSTREGFNRSLAHFKIMGGMVAEIERGCNLADVLGERLGEKAINPDQVLPVLNALLVDRYRYTVGSHNLEENADSLARLAAETAGWRAMDLVVAYFPPELGVLAINPKNRAHWEAAGGLKRNELITVYAGTPGAAGREELLRAGIGTLIALVEGSRVKAPAAFRKGRYVPRKPARRAVEARAPARAAQAPRAAVRKSAAPAPAPAAQAASTPAAAPAAAPAPAASAAPSATGRRMTPMYSIPVTNELFHNGNVEAWKKIIQSYATKYPGLEVYVFYEGERIHDINTLFKWGKVKHGSAILIAVAGADIRDVAKLQRYLRQGASQMFEAFLKAPVNAVLNLF
ncbi:MAG: hypothetical protein A2177_02145 [Spirochaetes bacterium RBG_13_68_11]|nr:MAG: hypothetical protein A2177_02145 [Spirochaetes bacterium RBG_13_68_11]